MGVSVTCARPHEVTLVEDVLAARFTEGLPERLIGDKAYDSDPLDAKAAKWGVRVIAPHRAGRKRARTQDGRELRRYRRRWKIERLFSWLQNYRRVRTRDDWYADNFEGFVLLACMLILLKHF